MNRFVARPVPFVLCLALAVSRFSTTAWADGSPAPVEHIDPDGIGGSLVLCGGGKLPDAVRDKFIELAGGKSARLVIIPTASGETAESDGKEVAEIWKARGPESVTVLHTLVRDEAN